MMACTRLVWLVCALCATGSVCTESTARAQSPVEGPVFTVSGRVLDADGRPARDVTLMIGAERDGGFSSTSCEVGPDGVFQSRGLAPGLYALDASAHSAGDATVTGGYAAVAIRDADLTNVVVTLQRATTISGQVKFESEQEIELPRPTVVVHAMLAVEHMRMNHVTTAGVADDGSFTLSPLYGPRLLRVGIASASRPGMWLKAVRLDGVDVTNVPVDFSTRPSARLEVVFSDRPTAVVGIVHDEAGLPVDGARVLVFSKDASMWAAWSTAVQTGISDENGRFWFVDAMPAGDYRAIALRETPTPSIGKAVDELARLEKFATPIVLGESKIARIELIVSRAR
jgi:Carboxypeptidase regulatory-like domain